MGVRERQTGHSRIRGRPGSRESGRATLAIGILAALLSLGAAQEVGACSSCGCILSTDWAAQGYTSGSGFRLDLRFDYFDQTELWSGSGRVDRDELPLPSEQEIQKRTLNRNYTATFDYSPSPEWGISVTAPFFDRYHTTYPEGETELATSDFNRVGDVRITARYQGFSADRTTGVLLGVKLPTGATDETFVSGPAAGEPLDRGLQPGTGTTDLLVGAYHYGALGDRFNYFAQLLFQVPVGSYSDFRPGNGLNASVGLRYLANRTFEPMLQLSVRAERRESGNEADVANSGAVLAYLGPGVTVSLASRLQAYAFLQVPVYQNVNGLQLEPRYAASVGLSYAP
jgi:hypothetical protein